MKYEDWKRVYVDKKISLKDWQKQRGNDTITSDIQRFNDRLPEGNYNLTIRRQVQNRHIEGTKEYLEYVRKLAPLGNKPSLLAANVNAAELVRKFHGTGIYDPNPRDNSPREIVDVGEVVGQYWDNRAGKYVDTTFLEIVYSKHGTHVYPVYHEGS